ncbi:hypothetical protein SCB49_08918 [unidentified eubacterium SCB49]|nr:hypothetical protein SCB49_08918 [unidentified eubacterium SCB49]
MNTSNNYLTRLAHLEIMLAGILIFMPLVLFLVEKGDTFRGCEGELNSVVGFRDSISDYVYMHNAQIFGMFLAAAAMMFIYNGIIYFKKEKEIKQLLDSATFTKAATEVITTIQKEKPHGGKFYNIIFGLSLLGVLLFPHCEFPIPHYVSAVIFFVGSIVLMAFAGNEKFRKTGIVLAVISAVSLGLTFADISWYTLFFAEWIALTAIAIHYVLEANYNAN